MYQRHVVKSEVTPAQMLAKELLKPKLNLPSFPDAALRVRKVLEDPNSSSQDVVKVLRLDPAIAARVLRLANSAPMGGCNNRPITDLSVAVSRVGGNAVRSAAMSMAMQQIYQANAPQAIVKQMASIWKRAVKVSAMCYVIAKKRTKISPDEAMLAGLMHNIGKLYIVNWTEFYPSLLADQKALDALMLQFHGGIGRKILESWGFAESLCNVPDRFQNVADDTDRSPDLADLVAVSALHAAMEAEPNVEAVEHPLVSVFKRLGLTPQAYSELLQASAEEIDSLISAMDVK